MKIIFILDNLSKLNPIKDTSLRLIDACLNLKLHTYICQQHDLTYENNLLKFTAKKVKNARYESLELSQNVVLNQADISLIFVRKDPPFNRDYLFLCHLLSLIENDIKIINLPSSLKNFNEKLITQNFKKIIPPTLISSNQIEINSFLMKYKNIVCKPIDEMAGNKIFNVISKDTNKNSIFEVLTQSYTCPAIFQKFIPEIKKGDKRILIVNGNPLPYGILRIPSKNDFRGNLAKGGSPKLFKLSSRDLEIVNTINPLLIKEKLFFVGIDIIGNYLTEINTTSPTGLREIEKLSKKKFAEKIITDLL